MSRIAFTAFRVLPVCLLLTLTACGPAAETVPAPGPSSSAAGAQANAQHQNADIRFAFLMSEHHQRSVELADLVRTKIGVSAEVKALATKIKAVNEPEIAQLEGMLRAWGELSASEKSQRSAAPEGGDIHGGVSDECIAQLQAAEEEAAGQLYLELMIGHHQSSIKAAEEELTAGTNAEAIALAKTIANTQQMEIDRLRALQQ